VGSGGTHLERKKVAKGAQKGLIERDAKVDQRHTAAFNFFD
jgi:hypothetical protein